MASDDPFDDPFDVAGKPVANKTASVSKAAPPTAPTTRDSTASKAKSQQELGGIGGTTQSSASLFEFEQQRIVVEHTGTGLVHTVIMFHSAENVSTKPANNWMPWPKI
jgi:hypothetical protein